MDRVRLPIPVGILMMALSIISLVGWYFWDFSFVDPYFSTLVFFGSPFFIAMGFADPRPEQVPTRVRTRV
jgi:hypothetical protein